MLRLEVRLALRHSRYAKRWAFLAAACVARHARRMACSRAVEHDLPPEIHRSLENISIFTYMHTYTHAHTHIDKFNTNPLSYVYTYMQTYMYRELQTYRSVFHRTELASQERKPSPINLRPPVVLLPRLARFVFVLRFFAYVVCFLFLFIFFSVSFWLCFGCLLCCFFCLSISSSPHPVLFFILSRLLFSFII